MNDRPFLPLLPLGIVMAAIAVMYGSDSLRHRWHVWKAQRLRYSMNTDYPQAAFQLARMMDEGLVSEAEAGVSRREVAIAAQQAARTIIRR